MKIVNAELRPGQYFREVCQKRNIVLHHTVSSTAYSALTWWNTDPQRIGTAFVLDKDGAIYQAFEPRYWAHHLGLKTRRNYELNRCSIGIELVNEGPLMPHAGGGFRWNFAPGRPGNTYRGEVVEFQWRGFDWWAAYTPEQYEALNELLPYLIDKFDLPETIFPAFDLNPVVPDIYTVYSHCNVRRDKSDISPAFDFDLLTCFKKEPALT